VLVGQAADLAQPRQMIRTVRRCPPTRARSG
jgi:hypothetical protein